MKNILGLVVSSLLIFSSCNTSTSDTASESCCASKKDAMELTMNIPIKVKPEFVSKYKAVFEKCQAGTLQEEACLDYVLFQSYTDSTEFHLFERWTNKPGHLYHMQTEHFKVYKEESNGFFDTPKTKTIEVYACPCVN